MAMDLTFEAVCKSIQDEYPDIAGDINMFSDLALTLGVVATAGPLAALTMASTVSGSPAIVSAVTAVGTLANLFAVKDKIPQTVERIVDKIASKKDNDPLKQMNRMERAYYLICYTAFFESLSRENALTPLLKKIRMEPDEKASILANATQELQTTKQIVINHASEDSKNDLFRCLIDLPYPGDTFQVARKKLEPLYKQLAMGIEKFFTSLVLWESLHESERTKTKMSLEKLPDKALEYFDAQYYLLATKYPSFATWLNHRESDKARTQLSIIEKKLAALAEIYPKTSDIGLQHLSAKLESMSEKIVLQQVDKALQDLENKYNSVLQSPILDPKDTPTEEGKPGLTYPKRDEIFIPQAFKIIHYTDQKHLEPDHVWEGVSERNDLGNFLINHFLNPISERSPLIILGQPGSGKSLLTSMLAARMLISSFTPVRIELRNINAEADIKTQITGQITQVTGRKFDWGMLSDRFDQRPGLVLFDGYDELLQASGKVFSGYLRDVEQFQKDQIDMKRPPIRAIVTSRINLIDKADIPPDATIIRLLEFDDAKQKNWIDIWNSANVSYFQQAKVKPFVIPQNNKEIKELAGQPLLLLMLALYDSTNNQLHKAKGLNQTLLYDNLLRQFIERELRKDSNAFKNMNLEERENAIERQMQCFGVAAIGMFNRRMLHIHARQLDADLKFFGFEDTLPGGRGRNLSSAEKLFGSFFFVRLESTHKFAVHKTSSEIQEQQNESDIAYEFLHNTFGEFLTTDFILRKILNITYSIYKMSNDRYQQSKLRQTMDNPNSDLPGADWYASLMCAPLFSRPVIVNMMQQWLKTCLQQRRKERIDRRDEKEFLKNFDVVVESYLESILSKDQMPDIMIGKKPHSFDHLPTQGHIAIYTLNLILLRTMLDPGGYTFVEIEETTQRERFPSHDGTRAWDRLAHLWRSWFSLETLNKLAAIFSAERDGTRVHLEMKGVLSGYRHIEQIHNVGRALADDVVVGLSGFLLHDALSDSESELNSIGKKLESENIELGMELSIKQIRHINNRKKLSNEELESILNLRNLTHMLFTNEDSLASLLAEVSKVIQELTDIQGVKFEVNSYLTSFMSGNGAVSVEHFKLLRNLNEERFLREFLTFLDIKSIKRIMGDSGMIVEYEYINLYVEIMKYMRECDMWPEKINMVFEIIKNQCNFFENKRLATSLATEMLRLTFETGNHETLNLFDAFYQRYLEEIIDPEKSISVDLVAELVKLAREKGSQDVLTYFEYYLNNKLKERREIPSMLVIEVINLIRDVGNREMLVTFLETYVHEIISVRHIPIVLLIELLKLVVVIDSHQTMLQELRAYCGQLITDKRYIPHELATAMINLAYNVGDKDILRYFSGGYLNDLLNSQQLIPVELAVELVRLALESDIYDRMSIEDFYHKNINVDRCYLDSQPIGTLIGLHQLAQKFHDNRLLEEIERRVKL